MIDAIVPEPDGGAQLDHDAAARLLGDSIREALDDLDGTLADEPRRRADGLGYRTMAPRANTRVATAFNRLSRSGISTLSTGFSPACKELLNASGPELKADPERDPDSRRNCRHYRLLVRKCLARRLPSPNHSRKRQATRHGEARGLPAKTRPEGDAGAARVASKRGFPACRSSSSSATMRGDYYDFRLERDARSRELGRAEGGAAEPGQQHLAVHVDDHPLEYAQFEGRDPQGQYGAGTVEIWDQGTYDLVEEKRNAVWTVRLKAPACRDVLDTCAPRRQSENWLIIRKREATEQPGNERSQGPKRLLAYAPMLASLIDVLPRGDGWLYEVKGTATGRSPGLPAGRRR